MRVSRKPRHVQTLSAKRLNLLYTRSGTARSGYNRKFKIECMHLMWWWAICVGAVSRVRVSCAARRALIHHFEIHSILVALSIKTNESHSLFTFKFISILRRVLLLNLNWKISFLANKVFVSSDKIVICLCVGHIRFNFQIQVLCGT